jgi:hypothetical protein
MSGEASLLRSRVTVVELDEVWAAWWQEKQNEVVNMELVQGSGLQPYSARGVWLVYSTKPTPSTTATAAKSRRARCGDCTKSAGFAAVCSKTAGFLG